MSQINLWQLQGRVATVVRTVADEGVTPKQQALFLCLVRGGKILSEVPLTSDLFQIDDDGTVHLDLDHLPESAAAALSEQVGDDQIHPLTC